MGDFDEVERLQGGIRSWLLRSARSGRHELRGIGATAVLPLLCAAAFGPALADDLAPAMAGMGVLASVDAAVLARVLGEAAGSGAGRGALALSPGGTTLAVADGSSVRRWDVAFPAGLLAAACTIAGQSLTREQWADYAGSQPFQQVCPSS